MNSISLVSAYFQQEKMTVEFLDNLVGKLPENCKVILVNAGSEPIDHPVVTRRIDLPKNQSFSHSMNTGIRAARGDVCIIGNDVFPSTADWLDRLRLNQADVVVPAINREPESKTQVVEFAPAVCWLLPRATIKRVGLFDEQFIPGTFEDNDYCRRVNVAGGSILVDFSVTLTHRVSQTISLLGLDAAMQVNSERFRKKWELV